MTEFLNIVFSFPTIVFTISTAILLGFWATMALFGAGVNALGEADFDFDFDSDLDVGVGESEVEVEVSDLADPSGGTSAIRSLAHLLGLTSMPLLLALNLESLFAWLASVVMVSVFGSGDQTVALLVGLVILIASLVLGVGLTRAIGTRLSHLFTPTRALRRRELVGSVCRVTTERVTAEFGQAEVRDAEGGSLIVQIRCRKPNDLGSGDRALIYDLDTDSGVFFIAPDPNLAP